jgi:hypothetical protein
VIQPESIPLFTGDLGQLERHIDALGLEADGIRQAGGEAHRQFQGLSAFYQAPEAEDLFASTAPARDAADVFADKVATVADALRTYAAEVAPIAKRLEQLQGQARTFVAGLRTESGGFDENWTDDADKVDEHQALMHDVAMAQEAFAVAEIACSNKITALVGGTQYVMNTGSKQFRQRGAELYGYSAQVLDQAQELPWGTPVTQSHDWWDPDDLGYYAKNYLWDGLIVDGAWAAVDGLATLAGLHGSGKAVQAWEGLVRVVVGAETYLMESGGQKPTGVFASDFAQGNKVYAKEFAKGFAAWDQWKENPARAAGTVTFNLLTLGVGPLRAASAGRAGTAAKVASTVAKVGEAIDPIGAAVKVTGHAIPRIAQVTDSLRGVGNVPEVRTPTSVLEFTDSSGRSVLVVEDGRFVVVKDGKVVTDAPVREHSLTADTPPMQDRDLAGVSAASRTPEATAHVGDSASPQSSHGGTAEAETSLGHSRDVSDETSTAHSHSAGSDGGGADTGGPPVGGGSPLPDGPVEPRGNLPNGSWEGPQGLRLSPEENAAAGLFMDQALATEPRITEAVQAAAGHVEHGRLIGLEYRLKGEDSLKRKVATALLEDARLTPEGALANIRDSLRYTVEIATRDYSHGVQQTVGDLRARGFENVTFKNTWGGSGYKGIHSTWRDPSTGHIFEVQFHTPESFVAKMDTHVLYEKGRLPGVSSDEFAAIQTAQNDLFDRVPVPHEADSIRLDHDLHGTGSSTDAPDTDLGRRGDQSVHGNGPPPELTPEQRTAHDARLNDLAQRYSDDFDRLKQDPDHKGKVKPSEMDEARVALDLRASGKVPTDIQRPPGANQGDLYSPGTGEFYDIKGVHSDWPPLNNVRDKSLPFKGAYNPANNQAWVRKLEDQIVTRERIVILDMRNANQAAIDDVKSIVELHGWSDRVVWYP